MPLEHQPQKQNPPPPASVISGVEPPQDQPTATAPVSGTPFTKPVTTAPVPPLPAAPAVVPPLSRKERRAIREKEAQDKIAAEQKILNERIEAEIAKWRALPSKDTRKIVMARAEAKRAEEVAWSRSLDNKAAPILTVAGFSVGGLATLLSGLNGKESLLQGKPFTTALLCVSLLPFLYAAIKSVLAISPTLQLSEPVLLFFKLLHVYKPRHVSKLPKDEWQGHWFYGHTAQHETPAQFMQSAIAHFGNESDVLRDTLTQGYINAHINYDKSADIALSVRGILVAVMVLLAAAVTFAFGV